MLEPTSKQYGEVSRPFRGYIMKVSTHLHLHLLFIIVTIKITASFVNGKLWCPDSERAYSAVNSLVKEVNGVLLEVYVGDRKTWKDW